LKRLLFVFLLCVFTSARAQSYPSKPIRLLVPFAPGGSSSIVARLFAEEMSKGLGQQFIIDNKGGGGGNLAMQEAAHADPDGYTLIIGHIGSLAVNPYMYEKLPYDVDRDFAPVSLLAIVPAIFVVYHEVPAKNLRELVALAKQKPGELFYGSAGNGSAGHLAMEYLKQTTGMDLKHVPYKGTGPNVVDLVAGRTQVASAGTPPLMPHVKSGKLRVIAVGGTKRLASLPDVPTVAEQGYPGFKTFTMNGYVAPAATPHEIVERIAREIGAGCKDAGFTSRLERIGVDPVCSTPAAFSQAIKDDLVVWKEAVAAAGMTRQ
jgi:tripartite-type tricarboxylate transporter receptor subunit TctC